MTSLLNPEEIPLKVLRETVGVHPVEQRGFLNPVREVSLSLREINKNDFDLSTGKICSKTVPIGEFAMNREKLNYRLLTIRVP